MLASRNETNETRTRRDIIGALIVEQIETQLSRQVLEGRVDLVYEHACRALSNSQAHSQIFLMPVWRFLDRLTWMFRGSALPKTLAISGLIGAALLAMFIVPIDFDLEGNGKLKPSVERDVFAHIDGEVESVLVKHRQLVKEGDLLVVLKNDASEKDRSKISGELISATTQFDNATYTLSKGNISKEEKDRLTQQKTEAKTIMQNRTIELELLDTKRKKLERRSPISGIVTTWDVENVLNARPVVTGQVLMTVADTHADWFVEVLMPEKRMRYLDAAMNSEEAKKLGYLPVEFILMTDSSTYHKGRLYPDGIGARAELDAEDGAVVKLRCVPDKDSMEKLTRYPEARVKVDVKCGKRSAAFVVFQDPIEWVRAHVIF